MARLKIQGHSWLHERFDNIFTGGPIIGDYFCMSCISVVAQVLQEPLSALGRNQVYISAAAPLLCGLAS